MINAKVLLECTSDLNILYVEDDDALLSATKEIFEFYFKSVDTAVNGKEAFEKYISYERETGKFYDLIISDINMPECNGVEMSKKIFAKNEAQTIIFTTAHNTSDYLLDAISMGIASFILKPINNEQLMHALFKASQAITDKKMIDRYIEEVETLNSELLQRNAELVKSSRMLDTVISKDEMQKSKSVVKKETTPKQGSYDEEEDIKNQILQLINDDLFELKELLVEIDLTVIEIINSDGDTILDKLENLTKYFSRYAAILHYYTFFHELSLAMSSFAKTMKEEALPENQEDIQNIFMLLETFIYVLIKWQDDISSGDENNMNLLDSSMINDINTIINLWIQKEEAINEDLDDIFDF